MSLLWPSGGGSQQCSEGRTYSDAIISPNPETIRIMRVSQTFSVGDCTAACCDLPTCDLAWWFEGSCYLVSCMHPENCEPRTTGPIRSYLTFVSRPVQRPGQLLDYGDMMLGRGSPSGAWGDSLEDLRKDLPFLGKDKDGGPEETAEYSDEYKELDRGLLPPSNQPDPRGSAEYPDWSLLPSGEAGFNASGTGDRSAASAEKLQDPTPHPLDQEPLQALNESTWSPMPRHSAMSSVWPSSVAALPTEEGLEGEETLQLQEPASNSSGKEVRCAEVGEEGTQGQALPHSLRLQERKEVSPKGASSGRRHRKNVCQSLTGNSSVLCPCFLLQAGSWERAQSFLWSSTYECRLGTLIRSLCHHPALSSRKEGTDTIHECSHPSDLTST